MRASASAYSAISPTGVTLLPHPNPAVVFCEVEDGAVLLSTEAEVYYGLNAVGARVWSLLPPVRQSMESMCASLSEEYPDVDPAVLQADVVALLEDLLREGLVVAG